jgi:hypothetical protein
MDCIHISQVRDQWQALLKHGNEPSVSIKYCEILEWLSEWRLLEYSSPWN